MSVKSIVVVPEGEYGEGLTVKAFTVPSRNGPVKLVAIRTDEYESVTFDAAHLDALIEALQQLKQ